MYNFDFFFWGGDCFIIFFTYFFIYLFYCIKRFGLTARFGVPTAPRPPALENSPKFWVSRGTARTADLVSLNFGDVLGAGCWDYWWGARTAGTKKSGDFFRNITGFPDVSFQNIAVLKFRRNFGKEI